MGLLPQRELRDLDNFASSQERQPLIIAVIPTTYHLWFLFHLRSFSHVSLLSDSLVMATWNRFQAPGKGNLSEGMSQMRGSD